MPWNKTQQFIQKQHAPQYEPKGSQQVEVQYTSHSLIPRFLFLWPLTNIEYSAHLSRLHE